MPGLILLTFWSLIVPEIVIGGAGALESFGRSWRTVRGYAWNVFGTFILVFLILIAARDRALGDLPRSLPYGWRSFIADLVSGALVAPFLAAVVTLIYYRLTAAHGEQAEPGHGRAPATPSAPPVRAAASRGAAAVIREPPAFSSRPLQSRPPYGRPPSEPPQYGPPPGGGGGSPS